MPTSGTFLAAASPAVGGIIGETNLYSLRPLLHILLHLERKKLFHMIKSFWRNSKFCCRALAPIEGIFFLGGSLIRTFVAKVHFATIPRMGLTCGKPLQNLGSPRAKGVLPPDSLRKPNYNFFVGKL